MGNCNYREVSKTKAANTFNEQGEMEWSADGWRIGEWHQEFLLYGTNISILSTASAKINISDKLIKYDSNTGYVNNIFVFPLQILGAVQRNQPFWMGV